MKQMGMMFILFLIIPFLIISIFLKDTIIKNNKIENIETENNVIVRLKREATNKIETLDLENYVIGVVAGEMPVSFNIEALKAQAVAARSYVLTRLGYNKDKDYDVVDSTLNQVYLDNDHLKRAWKENYDANILKVQSAVLSTKGEYIAYNGKVADALFFSTSNGYTENSEEVFGFDAPYLRSVDSEWDKETSPVFNDEKSFTLEQFYNILQLPYSNTVNIKILKKSSTGRTLDFEINNKEMTGTEMVTKLSLRSNDFKIEQQGDKVTIKTTGFGHGVGMSQYGALGMAENGYKYNDILKHYYKRITIEKL